MRIPVVRSRFLTVLAIAVVVANAAAAATTKDFKPGDVRVCGAARCLVGCLRSRAR